MTTTGPKICGNRSDGVSLELNITEGAWDHLDREQGKKQSFGKSFKKP